MRAGTAEISAFTPCLLQSRLKRPPLYHVAMHRTLLLPLAIVALALAACGGSGSTAATPTAATGGMPVVALHVGDAPVQAEVARTPEQQHLGLGDRDSLAADHGMLFVFSNTDRYQFWMKGMRFALDFIWIGDDGTIREVTANAPAQPGVPDSELQLYQPQQPVRYVLEVNAGFAAQHNVSAGDTVDLSSLAALPPA